MNSKKNDNKKRPEDVLIDEDKKKVTYGEKTYYLSKISLEQLLQLIKFFKNTTGKIQSKVTNKTTGAGLATLILEELEEEEILKLFAIILQEDSIKTLKDNFNIADALGVITAFIENEDISRVFFQIKKITGSMKGIAK